MIATPAEAVTDVSQWLYEQWSLRAASAERQPVDSPAAEKLWAQADNLWGAYQLSIEEAERDLAETYADFLAGTGRI